MVEYAYDAWGNILSVTGSLASTVGQANPFRYRSYYYDTETGLYYLNSRYYDPQVGRFINADGILGDVSTAVGYNMFAYCSNNPVIREDNGGPIRIRANEIHLDNPNFTGIRSQYHSIPHFHIERRTKIISGDWIPTYTDAMEMFTK